MRQGSVPVLYVATVTSTPSQDGGVTPHYSPLLPTRQRGSHCHHKLCDSNDKKLPGPISISTLFCTSPPLTAPRIVDAGGREADWCVVMRGPARLLWYSDLRSETKLHNQNMCSPGPRTNTKYSLALQLSLSLFPNYNIIPHWKGFNTGNKEKLFMLYKTVMTKGTRHSSFKINKQQL